MNIQQGIQTAVDGIDLSQSEAADVMAQIMGARRRKRNSARSLRLYE